MTIGIFLSTNFNLFILILNVVFLTNGLLPCNKKGAYDCNLSWRTRILERYLEFESLSLLECAKECRRRRRCESFNYSPTMHYCELCYVMLADGTLDPKNTTRNIFLHSDINSWEVVLASKCETIRSSPLNSKCNVKTGEYEVSDCGPAPTFEKALLLVYGHHEIGNGVTYSCHDNHEMLDESGKKINSGEITVICTNYGHWDNTRFRCEESLPATFTTEEAVSTTELRLATVTAEGAVSTTVKYCVSPWKYFKVHCYFFNSIRKIWTEAKNECRTMGANLIKVDDKEENIWVQSQIGSNVWLGGNDRRKESYWIWETDLSVVPITADTDSYSNWNTREPNNNRNNEHCMEMYKNGKWNDGNCNNKREVSCEKLLE